MHKMYRHKKTIIFLILTLLVIVTNFNIIVTSEKITKKTAKQQYDMVIITPTKFKYLLTRFVEHKKQHNITTQIKTTEEIYKNYPGRDKSEQVKHYIKQAYDNYNIKYVLLLGGKKGQTNQWYIPVRYSHVEDKSDENNIETQFISDLYYADIYDQNNNFSTWDTNNNNIFAEWAWQNTSEDKIDLKPEVYIGRLACRNIIEVKTVVDKIIKYEKNGESDWFKNIVLIGGDTLPQDHLYEGEYETQQTKQIMEPMGFDTTFLWTSENTLEKSRDIINTLRNGAGFVHITGHGSPLVFSTHKPKNQEWEDVFYTFNIRQIKNQEKLPIFVTASCHDSQFDVTLLNLIKDKESFFKGTFIPECLSWHLVRQKNGGAIATIGNSGLGYVYMGKTCIERADGWMNKHFFEKYANYTQNNISFTLGKLHWETINDYIETFPTNTNFIDCKTVQQRTLLGDPSLKIGGYKK